MVDLVTFTGTPSCRQRLLDPRGHRGQLPQVARPDIEAVVVAEVEPVAAVRDVARDPHRRPVRPLERDLYARRMPVRAHVRDAYPAVRAERGGDGPHRRLDHVGARLEPPEVSEGRYQADGPVAAHAQVTDVVVPGIGPVDTDEIVKGFELDNGRYVLLEQEEIDDAKVEAKRTLDLVQFVEQGEIDPIWFDRPYYVTAEGDIAEEAYAVLRDALRATKRFGVGQFVMRGHEYLAAVKPCGHGLMLETMRFADEVREAAPYFTEVSDEKPDKELLDLAVELIERKAGPFEPEQFRDRYADALREMIEEKARTGKPIEVDEGEEPERGAKVIDLVEALKRSVARGERTPPAERGESPRRKAS